jgi:hypothetical protein
MYNLDSASVAFMRNISNHSKKAPLAMLVASLVLLAGCSTRQLPNPNDLKNVPPDKLAAFLHQEIRTTSDMLDDRVQRSQISDDKRNELLAKRAEELLKEGDPDHSSPGDAWMYADLLMTDKQYKRAIPVLQEAVKNAEAVKNDDRRVNDSFRLARAYALTGQTAESLNLAQKIIDSKPTDPGPVLPSVLLQLTPATAGKGHDEQLAHLLEEAIQEHLRVKVDPQSEAGKMFLLARPHHIHNAWREIVALYKASGHPDEAAAAQKKEEAMITQLNGQPA